jgi:UDPglucose--hexose-1-phosphate uridylyltransferase
MTTHPHRRHNPLEDSWVLVSPHRTQRPWLGQVDTANQEQLPTYDPECALCPGNERVHGKSNPVYDSTHVFDNDFPAILPESEPPATESPLLQAEAVTGQARVICFSPRHDLTLARMPVADIRRVIDLWIDQTTELSQTHEWVQVFENKGAQMGSSNPHPHGQLWATSGLPNLASLEQRTQADYFEREGRNLLADYAKTEEGSERVVIDRDGFVVVVPFWAAWPFETLLLPRWDIARLSDLSSDERNSLASVLSELLIRYDNLFETSFPYSMGWHGAPGTAAAPDWQLHAHFYPPLLRNATVRKFMVGYEMLGEPQRDITPESAAERLRAVDDVHYLDRA